LGLGEAVLGEEPVEELVDYVVVCHGAAQADKQQKRDEGFFHFLINYEVYMVIIIEVGEYDDGLS
jgi:hypothetical protein